MTNKVLLDRNSFENLQKEIIQAIEKHESIEYVLDEVSEKIGKALTAEKSLWNVIREPNIETNLPSVDFTTQKAEIFVPTSESPFYKIHLKNFGGGRRLLSEEVAMLEAVSLLTARRIDALRIIHERFKQERREQEYTKLTTEAQLTALRSQINPHFLFNALTTIGYLTSVRYKN